MIRLLTLPARLAGGVLVDVVFGRPEKDTQPWPSTANPTCPHCGSPKWLATS